MNGSLAGRLLVASTDLVDPNFARTVVFLLQHDDEGALGLVLNRPSESPVVDHLPWLADHAGTPPVVFIGGPVEPEVAIALEQSQAPERPTAIDGVGILDVQDTRSTAPCRVFSGYAGWGGGQLEGELGQGAWYVVDAVAADVFTDRPDELWSGVLRRQGGHLALMSTFPPDPALN